MSHVKHDVRLWFLTRLRLPGILALCFFVVDVFYQSWRLYADYGLFSLSDVPVLLAGPCLIFAFGWGLPWPSRTWREVERLRHDFARAPLHDPQPFPYQPTDFPILLRRRISRSSVLLFCVLWIGLIVVFIGIGRVLIGLRSQDDLLAIMFLSSIFIVCGFLLLLLIGVVFYQNVEADEHGFLVQRGLIRKRIAWDQALLFAYGSYEKAPKKAEWVELSGPHVLVRWSRMANTNGSFSFSSAPNENYARQIALLESYIHLRTGLPLRNLCPLS